MAQSSFDRVRALIIGFEGLNEEASDSVASAFSRISEDIRLAKAAALYADDVTFASQHTSLALARLKSIVGDSEDEKTREASRRRLKLFFEEMDEPERDSAFYLLEALKRDDVHTIGMVESGMIFSKWLYGEIQPDVLPLPCKKTLLLADPAVINAEVTAYIQGPDGVAYLKFLDHLIENQEGRDREMTLELHKRAKEVRAGSRLNFELPTSSRSAEGQMVVGVLGGLKAFPDADWDVIFDVRDRLAPSRTRFRAAISRAAEELKEGGDIDRAAVDLRRRVIEPALSDIDEALKELGAIPTLLRLSQGTPVAGAVGANLALAAADPMSLGINAIAHGLASAPALASGIKELAHRRERRKELAARPFWFLRELRDAVR